MTLATVKGAGEGETELTDEVMVGNAEIAQFEDEGDEVGYEVWGVDAAIDKDGTVDVRMGQGCEG